MDRNKLKIEQLLMARQVVIPSGKADFGLQEGSTIGTFDIQYQGEWGYVALDFFVWEGKNAEDIVAKQYVKQYKVEKPYVPGYFAFREGPLLLAMLEDLQQQLGITPDLLVVDGHGTAHPRKFGVACWLGVKSGLPTIGVAKDPLLRMPFHLDELEGSYQSITIDNEIVGFVLRTKSGVKPVYVSSGHLVSQEMARVIAFALRSPYRLIAPVRRADQAARAFAKGQTGKTMQPLS